MWRVSDGVRAAPLFWALTMATCRGGRVQPSLASASSAVLLFPQNLSWVRVRAVGRAHPRGTTRPFLFPLWVGFGHLINFVPVSTEEWFFG